MPNHPPSPDVTAAFLLPNRQILVVVEFSLAAPVTNMHKQLLGNALYIQTTWDLGRNQQENTPLPPICEKPHLPSFLAQ